jgi:hypothetical protein
MINLNIFILSTFLWIRTISVDPCSYEINRFPLIFGDASIPCVTYGIEEKDSGEILVFGKCSHSAGFVTIVDSIGD